MKLFKWIAIVLVIGVGLGFAAGYNVGKGKPLLSNPFDNSTAMDKAARGLEKAGEGIKEAFK